MRLRVKGLCGEERVLELEPDYGSAWLMLERPVPPPGEPWALDQESAPWSVFAIESLTLEDVNDDEGQES